MITPKHDEIAISFVELGHILEVHSVNARDCGRHGQYRRPGGKLASDGSDPLLFDQRAELEDGVQGIAEAVDPLLHSADVITDVAKVSACVRLDAG